YVRLMRAFQENRQAAKSTVTIIGLGQVLTPERWLPKKMDEETRFQEAQFIDAQVVPAVNARKALLKSDNSKKQTVGKKHRAQNAGRKGKGCGELIRTRRKVHHRR